MLWARVKSWLQGSKFPKKCYAIMVKAYLESSLYKRGIQMKQVWIGDVTIMCTAMGVYNLRNGCAT